MRKPHPKPPYNEGLRSVLYLIDLAMEQSNAEMLHHISVISIQPSDNLDSLDILIGGYVDKINDEHKDYWLHTQEQIDETRDSLMKEAFGNFNEAMYALYQDLLNFPYANTTDELESDILKPELFDVDEEDMTIWNEMRDLAAKHRNSKYSRSLDDLFSDGADKIRHHQQKYYGDLIPVIAATYNKPAGKTRAIGYTITLGYNHPTLHVKSAAPFNEELDDYFINRHPVKRPEDFKPSILPQKIGGYTLSNSATDLLYGYELHNDKEDPDS